MSLFSGLLLIVKNSVAVIIIFYLKTLVVNYVLHLVKILPFYLIHFVLKRLVVQSSNMALRSYGSLSSDIFLTCHMYKKVFNE